MKSIKKELFHRTIFKINTYNIIHQRIIYGDKKFIMNVDKIGDNICDFEMEKIFGSFFDYMMYQLKP